MELTYNTLFSDRNQFFVKRLYEEAFPENERRDFVELLQLLHTEKLFNVSTVFHKEIFIGFITFWRFRDFVYIEHFATDKTHRNKGYGGKIFQEIYNRYHGKVILETEPPDDEMAVRRIHFYEHLGMTLTDLPYIQPAYSSKQHSIPLRIMVGENISTNLQDIQTLVNRMVSRVYYHQG